MIIYRTINNINNKQYIGKDSNNNPNYYGSGVHLKRAIKKYGKQNFKKETIEECNSTESLNNREKYWISFYNATNSNDFYNIAEGGDGGRTTEEPWNKGKKIGGNIPCSDERRENIRKSRLKTKKIECTYCGKLMDPGNYKKYHGKKCKQNPNVDPQLMKERSNIAKNTMKKQKENGNYKPPKTKLGEFKCPHCNKIGKNYGAMMRHHFNRCPLKKGY